MDEQRRGKVVAKLAQRFFDVRTADDKDLVFSSEFPLLKEEASEVLDGSTLPADFDYHPIYTHDLGYHPFFIVIAEGSSLSGSMYIRTHFAIDSSRIYAIGTSALPAIKFRWFIYRLPLYDNFSSTNTPGATTAINNDRDKYVLKVAKRDKSIASNDMRDFTIHSLARSPLVHIVSKKEWASGDEMHNVEHGLPYNPISFAFSKFVALNGKTTYVTSISSSLPRLISTPDALFIQSNRSITTESSIVVFEDPFLAPVVKEVIY